MAVVALSLSGCSRTTGVTTSDGRPMPPDPRPAPQTPAEAPITSVVLLHPIKAVDTNGNAYGDHIPVEVYLIAEPHPTPTYREGTFDFVLLPPSDESGEQREPIAQWSFDSETAQKRRIRQFFGPGYAFELSLLDSGGERGAATTAQIVCRFQSTTGAQAASQPGGHLVRIGR